MTEGDDIAAIPPSAVDRACVVQRGGSTFNASRCVPEEVAIALSFNGSTHAVMMATPSALEDFAVGFALTEGLIESAAEITSLDVVPTPLGIDLRVWLQQDRAEAMIQRRRTLAGPTGCGLCGIESLEAAMRPAPRIAPATATFDAKTIAAAMNSLAGQQKLNETTHAVHAAGFWTESAGLVALREDVGRHNALDKLIGALLRSDQEPAHGFILMTSRVSIELIQKAARYGAPVLAAISAPTAAAIKLAEASNITLIAVVRGQDFEIFTHPERFKAAASRHVA